MILSRYDSVVSWLRLGPVDVEVGNELFWYIFNGEPKAKDGYINLDDSLPGLGLTVNEAALKNFEVIE